MIDLILQFARHHVRPIFCLQTSQSTTRYALSGNSGNAMLRLVNQNSALYLQMGHIFLLDMAILRSGHQQWCMLHLIPLYFHLMSIFALASWRWFGQHGKAAKHPAIRSSFISHSCIKVASFASLPQCDQQRKTSTSHASSSGCQCRATKWHVQSLPTLTAFISTTNNWSHTVYPWTTAMDEHGAVLQYLCPLWGHFLLTGCQQIFWNTGFHAYGV